MDLDTRMFSSKVARRAFVLFVGCALLPISIFSLFAIRQVTAELREQGNRRLRQASKATGLELHRRLYALDAAMDLPNPQVRAQREEGMRKGFLGVVLVTPDGRTVPVEGTVENLPAPTPDQWLHLSAGETVLSTVAGAAGSTRFLLARAVDRRRPESGILQGEIDPRYIWFVEDESTLERGTVLNVLDAAGKVIISSAGARPLPPEVRSRAQVGAAGQFNWNSGDEDFLASYWSLFLKNSFYVPKWTIVLSRTTSDILAPIASFERTFYLVSLLSLLVVLWLSFIKIRKILHPLARLQEATLRLAQGRLDTRVHTSSGDEFESLARSFNQMASQLGRQFDALTMRSEITVALSRNDPTPAVLQSCVEILVRHLHLGAAGVWLTGADKSALDRCALGGPKRPAADSPGRVAVGDGEIGRVVAEGRPYASNSLPAEFRRVDPAWPGREELVAFVGHPLAIEGRVHGVLGVYAMRPLDTIDLGSIAAAAGEIAQGIARRRAAEALQNSEVQVRQLQKTEAVGRLAGGIAHDFNNLLTVVMGYSELLLMGQSPEDPRYRSAQIIQKTAGRAAKLTQQLLAFSRKQVLAPTLVDLNTLVKDMSSILRRLIGESIELVFKSTEDLTLAKVDQGQIEQVLVNLVVNARDAMPKGGKLTVETAAVDFDARPMPQYRGTGPGKHVMLRVTDTGTGMDAATQAKIFEPFFTTKEPGKGTGLGLATVSGIVAQSGGSIHVESELGRGTVFTIFFPQATGKVEALTAASRPVAGGNETVLLVEDEQEVRALVEQVLKNSGYVVLSAGRPSDALRMAEEHAGPIHLLLTDMVMPEMSGAVLSERLCATRPETVVLQMSGYTDFHGGATSGTGAPTAFLQKPFTPDTVARAVRTALDSASAPR